ncbi:MAG: hypothetical protein HC899_23145 [Leptolyngbyaceae cyanobacterium SM1_4_3]|nr:hypothetical protein [Leptolyngbyaceae cyanobacterium SM1_4_3]
MNDGKPTRYRVKQDGLPNKVPTHGHEATFWESLGRAVATFGFLEDVLGKAIFAFTATRTYEEDEIEQAYVDWLPKLERALIDPLGNLVDTYGRAVKDNPDAVIENLDELLDDLRQASQMRNILCHGSWRLPNASGASVPFFVNRQKQIVDTAMDQQFIDQVQRHTVNLICAVINTVTQMGWQFPGTVGSGKTIWESTAQQSTAADGRK